MSGSAASRRLLRFRHAVSLPNLKQGATLSVRSSLPNVSVRVESGWRDTGQATLYQTKELLADMTVLQEADQMTSLGRSESHLCISLDPSTAASSLAAQPEEWTSEEDSWEAASESRYALKVEVPEKVNLICELHQGGDIDVAAKIEGDVKLITTDGKIRAKKLRGHTIELETRTEGGSIYSSGLLEAQNLRINLQGGGRFRAKRIHGDTVDIRVGVPNHCSEKREGNNNSPEDDDDEGSLVDISSMYVSGTGGAQVVLEEGLKPEKRGVRIKSHHGPVMVTADGVCKPVESIDGQTYPLVELGSVNGSCEVSIRGAPNAAGDTESWTACQVHYDSISPESVSLITAETGNVGLTIDRKLEADMRLLSASDASTLGDQSSLLADDDDSQQVLRIISGSEEVKADDAAQPSRISVKTESFTESVSFVSSDNQIEYVEGWVENKSHEPDSRFEMKTRGKEALHAAAGKIRLDGAANQALKNFSAPQQSTESTRPLIVAASVGQVTLETLSWLGAIARRYGLDEKGRELGRQATRRGRVVLPTDE